MCGIAGIFAYSTDAPPVDEVELLRIREAMKLRGPDGDGLWISPDRSIGLAHRRLSIIDTSEAGCQPMSTEDRKYRVVFNGAIYNYLSLRSNLEQKGCRFRSHSDTEVLLHLYAEEGTQMVHHLRGMYAFALYDGEKKGIFLARDPFGIKPLYYADDGKILRFASQVKALLAGGRIARTPEPAGHVGFFLWGNVPEPYTIYKEIRALPAGSSLWVGIDGTHKFSTHFNITEEISRAEEAVRDMSVNEIRDRLQSALTDSVQHHLVADVPVGIFLSSGLDSTTITAIASEVSEQQLRAITLGFEEYRNTSHDEIALARKVTEQYRIDHTEKWITKSDFESHVDQVLEAIDQPSIDGINTYFVSKVAAESGLKVALSGLGGDELFGGYPSFKQIPRTVKSLSFTRLFQPLGKAFRLVSAPLVKHFTSPKYAGILEYGGTYGGAYLLRRGLFMPWELPKLLDGEVVQEGWNELQPLVRLEETIAGIHSPRLKITALELMWYMRNQLLKDTDWAGMAHSVEIRVPFVDAVFIRNIAPLLATQYVVTKTDVARTLKAPLPSGIFNREKTGFAVPMYEWLLPRDGVKHLGGGLRAWSLKVWQAKHDSSLSTLH